MKEHFYKKGNKNISFLSLICLILISIVFGSFKPSLSTEIQNIDFDQIKLVNTKPRLDYLDNLPSGDYIVWEGDHIRISFARNIPFLITEATFYVDGKINSTNEIWSEVTSPFVGIFSSIKLGELIF